MELTKLNPPSQINHQDDTVSSQKPPFDLDLKAWDPFRRNNIRAISYLIILAVVVYLATVYTFWPSDRDMNNIMQLRLRHVSVHTGPVPAVDVAMNATVEVSKIKAMYYSLDYTTLHVTVGYKGKELGNVTSEVGGHVTAIGVSYVDAKVEVEGIKVGSDDLAKGLIQFDTVAQADGFFSFVQVPLKAKYSCEMDVDLKEQSITHQICYPMAIEVGFNFTIPIPFLPSGELLVKIVLIF